MGPHRCHQPPRVSLQGDSHSPPSPASLPTHPSKAHHHLCPAPKVSCIQPLVTQRTDKGLGEAGWVPRTILGFCLNDRRGLLVGGRLGECGGVGWQKANHPSCGSPVLATDCYLSCALSSFTPSMPGPDNKGVDSPNDPGASVCHRHPCLLLQATKAVSIPSRTASPMLTATGPLSQQPPGMDWWVTPTVSTPCDPTPTPASAHLYLHRVSFPRPPFPERYQGWPCLDFVHCLMCV